VKTVCDIGLLVLVSIGLVGCGLEGRGPVSFSNCP